MLYRENAPNSTTHIMRHWTEQNWDGALRVVGIVNNRFNGKRMMTSPVLGIDQNPLRVTGQPDLLDDGMIITTMSGSRYLLDLKGTLRHLRYGFNTIEPYLVDLSR